MLVVAHNVIIRREKEWPVSVTILEIISTDARGSYHSHPRKMKKPSHITVDHMDH